MVKMMEQVDEELGTYDEMSPSPFEQEQDDGLG